MQNSRSSEHDDKSDGEGENGENDERATGGAATLRW